MNRIAEIARKSFAPEAVQSMLESLLDPSVCTPEDFDACSDSFLSDLGKLLAISPPMLDTLRSHPEYLIWLENQVRQHEEASGELFDYQKRWEVWTAASEPQADIFEKLRIFKRREYQLLSFLDIAGKLSFEETVLGISELADWVIRSALDFCWQRLAEEEASRIGSALPENGFAVIAMGKLGGMELNYSSDVDLVFCRQNPQKR